MNHILEYLQLQKDIDNKRFAVLMRHADRNDIPLGTFGNDVLLTEEGKVHAEEFGSSLSAFTVTRIYTSPLARCKQSAVCIKRGLQKDVEIVEENALGNPGFHIEDAQRAGKHFLEKGGITVFEYFVSGMNLAGVASIETLRTSAKRWLSSKITEKGVTLFITHDSLIAHFAYANGIFLYIRENWVEFLDGIVIDLSSGGAL